MKDCIFCKIIGGEIPAAKVYEDELTIAFLTIEPAQPGHTLVVTKSHVDQFIDLPEKDHRALWDSVKKVAKRLRSVTGKQRVGVVIKGIDVPHAHVHLIPFDAGERLKADEKVPFETLEALAEMAAKIRGESGI